MSEVSLFWSGTTIGDAAATSYGAPYSDDEFTDVLSILLTYDRATQGVIATAYTGYTGMLAVTNPSGMTIRTSNGAAMVDGKLYLNTANIDNTVATAGGPGTGITNYYRIVLHKDFVAQTVRVLMLGPSTTGIPALTQVDGTTWEIPLASVAVSDAGVVTVTGERTFVGSGVWYRTENDAIQADLSGNERGDFAIDGQQVRSANAMVASGDHSVIAGGKDNTVTNDYGFATGFTNNVSGYAGAAVGEVNVVTSEAGFASGYYNSVSGLYAAAIGKSNIVSGRSAVAFGEDLSVEGDYSFTGGRSSSVNGDYAFAWGYGAVASGDYDVAFGVSNATGGSSFANGLYCYANVAYSHAEGRGATARSAGSHTISSKAWGSTTGGDCQSSRIPISMSVVHSDANWHSLFPMQDGATDETRLKLLNNSVWAVDILIVGTTSGCTKSFGYKITGVIENDGGTTTVLAQQVTALYEADDTDFDAQIAADDTNDALLVQVKDATSGGDTVRWFAVVTTAETQF